MNEMCVGCGACCRDEIPVLETDDVPERLLRSNAFGKWMKNADDGVTCAALDKDSRRCTIYEKRPTICREFVVGGATCSGARKFAGIYTTLKG